MKKRISITLAVVAMTTVAVVAPAFGKDSGWNGTLDKIESTYR